MAVASTDYEIIPLTTTPNQITSVTLGSQACSIHVYTKSINVPIQTNNDIPTDPNPTYENINPVFLDILVNGILILGGVLCRGGVRLVRDAYLGFVGDLAFIDTTGAGADPYGVSYRLPPPDLRNLWQRAVPLKFGGLAPPSVSGTCPGLGTRFLLTYWPNLP